MTIDNSISNNHIDDIMDISSCKILSEENTHGGFHGDGEYFAKIDCSSLDNFDRFYKWKKLPLSQNIQEAMNMEYCDNNKCVSTLDKYNIPKIESGYYVFIDRHPEDKNTFDDTDLNNRYSYNFSLAMFDNKTKIIYFYELDT